VGAEEAHEAEKGLLEVLMTERGMVLCYIPILAMKRRSKQPRRKGSKFQRWRSIHNEGKVLRLICQVI